MKFNYAVILIVLISFLNCQCSTSRFYDGEYVFIDSTHIPATQESIAVNGTSATLRFRSLFNKSKLKKAFTSAFNTPVK